MISFVSMWGNLDMGVSNVLYYKIVFSAADFNVRGRRSSAESIKFPINTVRGILLDTPYFVLLYRLFNFSNLYLNIGKAPHPVFPALIEG